MTAKARVPGAVFILSLALYAACRSYFFNFDGVACAVAVDLSDFKHLVHGNHLAYGVVAWAFARLLGTGGPSLPALQVLSGLLGAAGAAVFSSLLLRAGRPAREAALAGAALALSHAWWFWSLEAQVYMLGALFAALAAREALADEPRPWATGLWHGAAILGHAGHAMAAPALLYALTRRGDKARAARDWAASAGAVVLAAYALAAVFAVRPASLDEWRLWLLGSAALGYDRSFSWHGSAPGVAVASWLRLSLEVFLAPPAAALALLPLGCAARALYRGTRTARFWGLWLAGYAALFLLWEPGTIVYRVPDLLALWALALEGLDGLGADARASALAVWCAAALPLNWRNAVLPASDPASNPDLVAALSARAAATAGAWALATGRGQVYLPYFAGLKPLNPRYWRTEAELFAKLDALAAAGEPVFASERALDESGWRASFERYGLAGGPPGLRRVVRPAASRKAAAGRSRR